MKRYSLIIVLGISLLIEAPLSAQDEKVYDDFLQFAKLYGLGDLGGAQNCMLKVLASKDSLSGPYIVAAYNNLGAVCTLLGRYKEALEYYDRSEAQISSAIPSPPSLAHIFVNKAIIYGNQGSYPQAVDYFEKGIRIFKGIAAPGSEVQHNISTSYMNLGVIYYKLKDYKKALGYFKESAVLKERHGLSKLALSYFNIARTFAKTGNSREAEEFFIKSLDSFKGEFGNDYFRSAEIYFEYGLLLESQGRASDALEILNKALYICQKSYGKKHPLLSLSYKYLGDHFMREKYYREALEYYQRALIAISADFNDMDILSSPRVSSSLYDTRLLEILKSKAKALELFATIRDDTGEKLKYMTKSLENIELAMEVISKIRSEYVSEESRVYLMDNEKETYLFATDILHNLYTLTADKTYIEKMYGITRIAKATELRSEISGSEFFYSAGLPDTIRQRQKNLYIGISAYYSLIQDEIKKPDADSVKTEFWKDAIFEMNRENENLEKDIDREFPQYRELVRNTSPISLETLQHNLDRGETLVEYFLANEYSGGTRELYTFLVTKDKLDFLRTTLDSLFEKDVRTIKEATSLSTSSSVPGDTYKDFTGALFRMYDRLIRPASDRFAGKRLIIIPDEEIAYLPFDAFISNLSDSASGSYEGLKYLIYDYTISYGFSSSLVFGKEKEIHKPVRVYAFSPSYPENSGNTGNTPDPLEGSGKEILALFRWFPGKRFLDEQASEANFKSVISEPAILHLAMHSTVDPGDSKYSCFLFDTSMDSVEDGLLYNYEISANRVKSPMVVLSACNTGDGTLYHGEGVMSLARGFTLAGAESVIKSLWAVNDEAGSEIISLFYYHLSKGKEKDEALRLAKLEYLETRPPVYKNPAYWAAYQELGDNAPVRWPGRTVIILACGFIVLLPGALIIYFRRRRIFSARFL